MTRLRDTIDRTPEYVNFIKELKQFHVLKGTTLQAEPVLGGRRLDLYKIFQVVAASGGFDEVTKNRGWKQVGDIFKFPSTCTNSAYILKGLGWEEEKLWRKDWQPPKELLGPGAHKSSTLAGKAYKVGSKKPPGGVKSPAKKKKLIDTNAVANYSNPLLFDFSNMDMDPPIYATAQEQLQHTNTTSMTEESVTDNNTFNEKDRILFALQFGQRLDVDWALNEIVHMSFECPEKLELTESPFLLQLLLSLAQPCLTSHAADNALPSSATDTLKDMMNTSSMDENESKETNATTTGLDDQFSVMVPLLIGELNSGDSLGTLEIILKVLHILRNFSFLATYIPILAKHTLVKEILVQGLETSMSTGHVELGRHSMDVLENIAAHMELTSEKDPCLNCVHTLVAAHDRYLVIGSIRTLTWLTMNPTNRTYLESSPVMNRIAQMLLSNDEELVGTALEYIYQHTRTSEQSRSQFLTSSHSSAYIGLVISLLMTKSKYFCSRFIQDDLLPTPNGFLQPQQQQPQQQPVVPRVPDLTVYQKLDEPFRCLGWLKDKFEVADRSSVLSLDDIYLLYEARFGLEKALKMRDFYTVMKIAFPKASTTSEAKPLLASPGQSSPVVEGLNILGIQIKMSILQDRPQVSCKWAQCSLLFDDTFTLQRHVLHDHMVATVNDQYVCSWSHCTQQLFTTKDDWVSHLRTHFYNQIGESCYNSPVQSPEPSLSSSPSTPTSNISSSSTSTPPVTSTSPMIKNKTTVIDSSDIQGIALVAAHLLNWLSKDPQSNYYFIPYEKELSAIAEQRPKLASHIWSISSNFKSSSKLHLSDNMPA
ncbi:hypothetical protein MFLAVUS_001174 [Mucor flavus]|uniref:ARID domain-containing protein n=1 Tax=Mucor flavus TaxID=439312 RepID=A0ABP9YLQ3_9FUNG